MVLTNRHVGMQYTNVFASSESPQKLAFQSGRILRKDFASLRCMNCQNDMVESIDTAVFRQDIYATVLVSSQELDLGI